MKTGATLEERREQRETLKKLYSDYDPKRHDVYVIRYNKEKESEGLRQWMERRGVK